MSKLIDLTGQKFGRLTVLYKDKERKTNSGSYWICQCECGNIKSIKSSSLRRGEIQSCGCYRNDRIREAKQESPYVDHLEGERFGKLVVISKNYELTSQYNTVYWNCLCDCGREKAVRGANLKRKDVNRTISCGCYHRSIGETEIFNLLTKNNIDFIDQYKFSEKPINRFSYDFALVKDNNVIRLIEFDGEQHYFKIKNWGSLEMT